MVAALCLVGCTPGNYTVHIVNNSALTTDFLIDEPGYSNDQFILAVPGQGGKVTLQHNGIRTYVTVYSGTAVAQQMSVIDGTTSFLVTKNDVVTITKPANGPLQSDVVAEEL